MNDQTSPPKKSDSTEQKLVAFGCRNLFSIFGCVVNELLLKRRVTVMSAIEIESLACKIIGEQLAEIAKDRDEWHEEADLRQKKADVCLNEIFTLREELRNADDALADNIVVFAKQRHEIEELKQQRDNFADALSRLCHDIQRRMIPNDPSPEDRLALWKTWNECRSLLENAVAHPPANNSTPTTQNDD